MGYCRAIALQNNHQFILQRLVICNSGAHAIIITYDITDQKSFNDAITYWFQEVKNYCPPETAVMLIGNKSDLVERREVQEADVENFAKQHNIEWIETSAKESDNIEAAFIKISKVLIKNFDKKQEEIKNAKPRRPKGEKKKEGEVEKEGEAKE